MVIRSGRTAPTVSNVPPKTTQAEAATQRSRAALTAVDDLEAFHADIRRGLQSLHVLVKEAKHGHLNAVEASHLLEMLEGPLLWHDEDEEVSLLPRLRRAPLTDEQRGVLERCHRGHDRLESLIEELVPELSKLAHGKEANLMVLERDELALRNLLEMHLRLEEEELFPVARKALSPTELDEIAAEIHARHGTRTGRRKRAVAIAL